MFVSRSAVAVVILLGVAVPTAFAGGRAAVQMPSAIAAPAEATVVTLHAEGVEVYECKAEGQHKLAWAEREPIATLMLGKETVGRHYAGPTWEHVDGSAIGGKIVASAPGKTPNDIPWLKLSATARRGQGTLSGVTTVQRINTRGGVYAGPCDKAGTFHSAPYSADYVFLQKGG
jgi:Protein of unknown function (DUF3455)